MFVEEYLTPYWTDQQKRKALSQKVKIQMSSDFLYLFVINIHSLVHDTAKLFHL